jgi:protein tyrosine/serine phosphatase
MNTLLHRLEFVAFYHNTMQENYFVSPFEVYLDNNTRRRFLRKKSITISIIVAALCMLLLLSYYLFLSPKIYPVIEGKIYRSAQLSGSDLEKVIKEKGIRTIINLKGKSVDSKWYANEMKIAEKYGARLFDVRISPNDLPKYLKLMSILDALQTSEKPILIHCHRGVDRSGMVSALALALEADPPISELKKQFSVRYGVLPFYRSVGPYFFSMYEDWLKKNNHNHSRDRLLYWVRHEYRDYFGNLESWIDEVDHIPRGEFKQRKGMISDNAKDIVIRGWAFDADERKPPQNLYLTIGKSSAFKLDVTDNRPDIARYFNLGDDHYQNFIAGWEATIKRDKLSPGCHEIRLKYIKDDATYDIPSDITLCL